MPEEILCPTCHQTDQVEKVSSIYVLGIGLKQPAASAAPQELPALANLSAADLRALSRRLAPPSSGKEATRPISPDLAVIIFSLVAPIFLYGILTTQRGLLLPMLIILAALYALYFWQRKPLLAKFDQQQAERQSAAARAKHGIQRWMRLYYCARDDVVFEPGEEQSTPADQMMGRLLS